MPCLSSDDTIGSVFRQYDGETKTKLKVGQVKGTHYFEVSFYRPTPIHGADKKKKKQVIKSLVKKP
jgi:hypothetical protein